MSDVLANATGGEVRPVFLRTGLYVGVAMALCCLIGYPVAYYVARMAGRRRGLLLALILAPWRINYPFVSSSSVRMSLAV